MRLPKRDFFELLEAFPEHRQSLLGEFDNCRLQAYFGLTGYQHSNAAQARGVIFHRFAAEVLNTLWATGEEMVPVEEAFQILYEVCAQRDVPPEEVVTVPASERRLLRILVKKFVGENKFRMDRLMAVEERLHAVVTYPAPGGGGEVERAITGQPDALVSDPPDGAIVLDWKTTLSPPPRYTGSKVDNEGKPADNFANLSYLGYFQQRCYALLVMENYPTIQRVTLREFYPLAGEARTSVVERADLEHVRRELSNLAEQLDAALMAGEGSPLWAPSPGRHCLYCPRPMECPIVPEDRGVGAIQSAEQAEQYAAEFIVADAARDRRREQLKAWVEVNGPVPVKAAKGRYEMRFKKPATGRGKGSFGVHVPARSDRGPAGLDAEQDAAIADAFRQAVERKRVER